MAFEVVNDNEDFISIISKSDHISSNSQSLANASFFHDLLSASSLSSRSSVDVLTENDSILIKSVFQDYEGILEGLNQSKSEFKERNSLALTTAKASLVEENKKNSEKNSEGQFLNVFETPGKFFCKRCKKEIISAVKYQAIVIGFWKSLKKLIEENKCCSDKMGSQDIIHECPLCQGMLARISPV